MACQRSSSRRSGVEMAIPKPTLSVQEARRLSAVRPEAYDIAQQSTDLPEPVASGLKEGVQAATQAGEPDASELAPMAPLPAETDVFEPPEMASEPDTVQETPPPAAPVTKPPVKPSAKAAKPPKAPAPRAAVPGQNIPRVQVFVSASVPAPGVSSSFDLLSRQYPPEKALQMILRRALDDYEEKLADGTFQTLPESYPSGGKTAVQTSRIMRQDLVELSRSHFDPLGFESTRAFGLKLASAALASFFAEEKTRR